MALSLPQVIAFCLLVIGTAGVVLGGFHDALVRAKRADASMLTLRVGVALTAWIGLTGIAAISGLLQGSGMPPRPLFVLLPALVGTVLIARSKTVGALLPHVPQWQPIAAQSFRIAVEGMLYWLAVSHLIPQEMTFEGLNYDILTGLLALPIAFRFASGRGTKAIGLLYHVLGLALLLTIVVVSVLAAPGPQRVLITDPPNLVPSTFPMVWLPAFLVPLALFLHLISLRQLFGAPAAAAPKAPRPRHARPRRPLY